MRRSAKRVRKDDVDWEKEYRTAGKKLWEEKPHTFSRLAAKYVNKGKVLDIGSGEGYDCLFFARKGYDVTAIDISRTAIKKLLMIAKRLHLKIKGVAKDINKFAVKDQYDVIVSYGTLQFLGPKFKNYVENLKNKTVPGGVHAFYVFGDKGDFYKLARHRFYFPSEKELKRLYAGWRIVKFRKKNARLLIKSDKRETLYNLMFKILAVK